MGTDLVELMDAQAHRGSDSTGFAIYGIPRESGFIVRAMGFDRAKLGQDLDDFHYILKEHGADFLENPTWDNSGDKHYSVRMVISEPGDLARWTREADTICHRLEVQSVGKSLEIIKDDGDARTVAEKHGVRGMIGTHGLGHARLATESAVRPNASHPFWARPFADVAIVHNGQITDYYNWRQRLERQGYRFLTQNDSELIAVWVSDQMSKGMTLQEALDHSIKQIDGVFTYMIADTKGIGFAKDRFAIKPLATVQQDGAFCAATEEQALRRVYPGGAKIINYDGPAKTGIWGRGELAA
ncbi:MAG: class II glutamine amidotransferase [Acidocella sp.]|nr:class II glutamine amidotransferase [Acidocella sp.]